MAGKPRNRLELRRQHEAAEDIDPLEEENGVAEDLENEEEVARKPTKKKPAKSKAKAKSSKTAKPTARMRVVWNVVNDAFKTVASFDFSQKDEAMAKAAELNAKGKGTFFVQKAKEPMPDDAPGLGATITRAAPPASRPAPDLADLEAEAEAEEEDEEELEEDEEDFDEDEED